MTKSLKEFRGEWSSEAQDLFVAAMKATPEAVGVGESIAAYQRFVASVPWAAGSEGHVLVLPEGMKARLAAEGVAPWCEK